jgi:hypothetical protein
MTRSKINGKPLRLDAGGYIRMSSDQQSASPERQRDEVATNWPSATAIGLSNGTKITA